MNIVPRVTAHNPPYKFAYNGAIVADGVTKAILSIQRKDHAPKPKAIRLYVFEVNLP
jgi:hypothetical protein